MLPVVFRGSRVVEYKQTRAECDLVILPNIQAVAKIEVIGEKRKERSRCRFLYQNLPICKEMFLHLYGLSYSIRGSAD